MSKIPFEQRMSAMQYTVALVEMLKYLYMSYELELRASEQPERDKIISERDRASLEQEIKLNEARLVDFVASFFMRVPMVFDLPQDEELPY